jgi:hypothetical protein
VFVRAHIYRFEDVNATRNGISLSCQETESLRTARKSRASMSNHRRTRTAATPATAPTHTPKHVWTSEQVLALGTTTDVVTAGHILGLSRNTAYRLARLGQFPVPVLRAGAQYRVPVAALLAALHITGKASSAPIEEVST